MVTETWQPRTVQTVLFRHSHCLRGLKQKDIDFYIWAKNERVAKEVDRWKEEGDGERGEERDLKGDLSLELPKRWPVFVTEMLVFSVRAKTNHCHSAKDSLQDKAGNILFFLIV